VLRLKISNIMMNWRLAENTREFLEKLKNDKKLAFFRIFHEGG
jgi:hypothetical protein